MNTRPNFAPLQSILELCEALTFAASYFISMGAWAAAEMLLVWRVDSGIVPCDVSLTDCSASPVPSVHTISKVNGISWTWAVQVEEMDHAMQTSFDSLFQYLLLTMCQCSLHQLACSPPFVSWSREAAAAAGRGDTAQVHHRPCDPHRYMQSDACAAVTIARVV